MKKKLIAGLALSLLVTSSLAGVGLKSIDNASHQDLMVAEAATTYSENIKIQTKLKRWGYYTGSIDGIYGSLTKKAVRYFQSKNGLAVDGIVGPKTAAAMGITLSSSASSSTNSSSDLYLLAKCVYAEARGEPYTGQVAVAAVILNRVKSSSFPNTISGVIYQPYAFTAVYDGQINLEPNSTAYKAAQDALNGWDPTYGCLYYYNPATATSSWIWSRQTVVTIGSHVFAL
ncbi:MAG: spore cortex-lytic enzyme [Clostridia bacterium]|nr:spore cortex-lytic enzyme [Clostridia bacterium]MBQ8792549.1 spore cortex-lytic enzyme [Clostridia bacterium]